MNQSATMECHKGFGHCSISVGPCSRRFIFLTSFDGFVWTILQKHFDLLQEIAGWYVDGSYVMEFPHFHMVPSNATSQGKVDPTKGYFATSVPFFVGLLNKGSGFRIGYP